MVSELKTKKMENIDVCHNEWKLLDIVRKVFRYKYVGLLLSFNFCNRNKNVFIEFVQNTGKLELIQGELQIIVGIFSLYL